MIMMLTSYTILPSGVLKPICIYYLVGTQHRNLHQSLVTASRVTYFIPRAHRVGWLVGGLVL